MKRIIPSKVLCILLFLTIIACGPARKTVPVSAASADERFQEYAPDRLIIMYAEDIGKEPLLEAVRKYKAEILYDYSIIPGMAIKIPEGTNLEDAIKYFKRVKGVVSVEKDHIIRLTDPVRPKLETM